MYYIKKLLDKIKSLRRTEDGRHKGRIEMIGLSRKYDTLYLNNRKPYAWIFSIQTGYRQLEVFKVEKPHKYYERQNLIVTVKDNKVVQVEED